jgi:hypothetical protein
MINQCPHCQEKLNLTAAQIDKVQAALDKLPEDNTLKLNCPLCKKPMELTRAGELAPTFRGTFSSAKPKERKVELRPPNPPKLDYLTGVKLDSKEEIKDVQEVLVLIEDGPTRESMVKAFGDLYYRPVLPKSARDAIERMRFANFAAIVLHSRYEGNSLGDSVFHQHMKMLPMSRRRSIFYTLIGPEFHTFYNIEALTNSANLVIKENEVKNIKILLERAILEYEQFFSPFVEALNDLGHSEGLTWSDVRRRRKRITKGERDILKDLFK